MRSATFLALHLLLAGGVSIAAEPPSVSPPFGERVEVEVVNVDVVVTDESGRRVTDLVKEDFVLEVDGRPTPIEYFALPALARGGASQPGPPALPRPAGSPDLADVFVFVDQSALELKASSRILAEIREFARRRSGGAERIMLAAFVEDLRILSPPTADWARIEKAFDELEALRGRGSLLASERSQLERDVRNFGRVQMPAPTGSPEEVVEVLAIRGAKMQALDRDRLESEIQRFGERELDRQMRALAALRIWIGGLVALEGRKTVIFASTGYSSQPAEFLTQLLHPKLDKAPRRGAQAAPSLQTMKMKMLVEFERLVREAQNARVAFYTVSPRQGPPVQASAEFGIIKGKDPTAPPPRDVALVEMASSLTRISQATGGASLVLDDGLGERLETVRDDGAAAYSLGFATEATAGAVDHAIEVRVNRPGLALRHRESFRRRTQAERAEEALVAALTLDATANDLGLVLELGSPEPLDEKSPEKRVPILVRIPLGLISLVPSGDAHEGRLAARVAVQNEQRNIQLGESGPIRISVPEADLERALGSFWAYRAEVLLSPGRHRLAVVVADEASGVVSTVTQTLDIPPK
jgi:VWFA-related protein